jgi:hypothetical protein
MTVLSWFAAMRSLALVLNPAGEPDDEKDEKNGSENAAADVHGNLRELTCESIQPRPA